MKLIAILMMLLSAAFVYAAPYKCGLNGATFADSSQCAASCGTIKCDELLPASSNSGQCDTVRYQGFFSVSGKTYALTKSPVEWSGAPTASIRSGLENDLIAKMLARFAVAQAWIGARDIDKSIRYNAIDKSRFKWRDKSEIVYDNWADGQPDNALDSSLVGNVSVYGEHWAVIDTSGKWSDIGLNSSGKNRLLPAVVEFSGERACVAGKNQTSSLPTGTYCSDNSANSEGLVTLDKCEVGIIFGSAANANLCPKGKTECIEEFIITIEKQEEVINGTFPDAYISGMTEHSYSIDTGGGWETGTITPYYRYIVSNIGNGIVNVRVDRWLQDVGTLTCYGEGCSGDRSYSRTIDMEFTDFTVKAVNDPEVTVLTSKIVLADGSVSATDNQSVMVIGERVVPYKFIIEKEVIIKVPTLVCPLTGRPCIESSGGYFCSPYDCLDSETGGTSSEETEEGSNDDNNNGEVDDDGNCLGQLIIFPGKDMRCRLPSALTAFVGCCHEMTVADANKPDIRLSKEQVMGGIYGLYLIGGPAYLWLMSLASIIDINICNGNEKQLGVNRGLNQCKYVGKYCSKKWDSQGCVQMKDTWCCFDSEFSRAFAEAGHDLLSKPWGTPESPQCTGFTPEELQQLSAMGISDHPAMKEFAESLGAQYSEKLMNEFKNNLSPTLKEDIKKEMEGLKE